MPEGDSLSKWASLIPEIYFDLIARVPAGAFLTLALLILGAFSRGKILDFEKIRQMNWAVTTVLLMILIGTGYSMGILLTPIARIFYILYAWSLWSPGWKCDFELMLAFAKGFNLNVPKNLKDWENLGRFSRAKALSQIDGQLFEYLKCKDNQARLLLPKLRAEALLCTSYGAAILVLFPFLAAFFGFWKPLLFTLGATGLCVWAAWYRSLSLIQRQFVFLRLYPPPTRTPDHLAGDVTHPDHVENLG